MKYDYSFKDLPLCNNEECKNKYKCQKYKDIVYQNKLSTNSFWFKKLNPETCGMIKRPLSFRDTQKILEEAWRNNKEE